MSVHLPKDFASLTLRQLIALETLDNPIERVEACCDITDSVRAEPMSVINAADEHLTLVHQAETRRHLKVIELNGQEYGFITDWDAFTTGEWIDLESYSKDFWPNAHKIMSVLYRPIERRCGEIYTITPYTAKEPSEAFLELPADLFTGCLLFFSSTRNELLSTMRSSLTEVAEMGMSLAKDGDGILSSSDSQMKTSSKWIRLQNYLSDLYSRTSPSLKT